MLKWSIMQPDKPIKVCYVITKGNWGGAQRYVYDLSTNLAEDQFEVVVICGEGDELPHKLHLAGIRTIVLSTLKRDFSFFSAVTIGLKTLAILYRERPDVLHLNSPKASGVGVVAGKLAGIKKIIYTVHGFAFNEERNTLNKAIIWFFSWITILLSHKTIIIAEKERLQAVAMPFVKNKIIFIHNGIEKIEYKEKSIAREQLLSKFIKHSVFNNILWLGTISELHKNKGLEYAISAVSKIIAPFVFIIIGKGEEKENLENLIKKYDLKDKVFLLGFVENANEYFNAFDIFLLSSIKEGLPYVILEAGQTGLPVIASRVGGIPDIIENGVNGILTTPGKAGEITRSLEYLISNPEKQKEFGKNIKEKVEKEFSLKQMLKKTKELYTK